MGRFPDGGNNFFIMNRPTIGETNSLHTYDEFIGADKGIIVEEPDAIAPILAKNEDQISISFAGTQLIIQGASATADLDIYSIAGMQQQHTTVDLTSGSASVATDNLPAGIYIANVKGANGSKTSFKFSVK